MQQQSAIVIGAGIVGLAMARALSIKGYSVSVFDKSHAACGASVRNFGMVWPIGQPASKLYNRAMRTRDIWKEIAAESTIWCKQTGSLHLAYSAEEWQVLQELEQQFNIENRNVLLLNVNEVLSQYPLVNKQNLLGGLFSADEALVDPRQAMAELPNYLQTKYNVQFYWNTSVTQINETTIKIGNTKQYNADVIYVCSGVDFETLYPEVFATLPITKCKLQMLRTAPMPSSFKIGTAICGGLSLLHYSSFKTAPSYPLLQQKMQAEFKNYLANGIHVMAAQNNLNEITIGDTHEYGSGFDPFDNTELNILVLAYLNTFLPIPKNDIAQTWHGIYPKLTNGNTEIILSPQKNVFIVNGLGGAGMTLSFGLAEEVVEKYISNI
jgi:FAD dependent oxidoreductase TIGR03364